MDEKLIGELSEWYAGRNVFVTGHTGFKGTWLTAWLKAAGASITGYALAPRNDRPSLFHASNIASEIDSRLADICDAAALERALGESHPEIVFHLAAQSIVRQSYNNPIETYRTNVMGTAQLLESIRKAPSVKAVVVVTSDKCYENRGDDHAYSEGEPMGGRDPYSSSKACAELVTSAFRRSFFNRDYESPGPAVATARAGNVIGPGDWAPDRLMPDLITAWSSGETVVIRNPSAVRPWQFVLEPLRGYLMLGRALSTKGGDFESAWNFGPEQNDAVSVGDLTDHVRKALGDLKVQEQKMNGAPHEAHTLRLDSRKAAERLGWRPVLSLTRTIDITVDGYRRLKASPSDSRATMSSILSSYCNDVDAAEN